MPTNAKEVDGNIADHFGRCSFYILFNEKGEMVDVIDNSSEHGGGQGLPPELMKKNGVDIVLCKDIGPRAISLCQELGIKVYVDRDSEKVIDIVSKWQRGDLAKAGESDACQDHKE